MESGDRILVAAGLTAAVVVGAFVLWGPAGAPRTRKRKGQIAGLQNLGRTCFLNTLLQAMAASPQFVEWLKRNATSGVNNSMITTLSTVIDVVNGAHAGARGGAVCPLGVLRCLGALGWVVPEDQHDAHELLHVLLSCLEEETHKRRPGSLSDALGLTGGASWLSAPRAGEQSAPLSPLGAPPAPQLRSVSSPATPDSPLVRCARSLSQAAIGPSVSSSHRKTNDTNGSLLSLRAGPYGPPLLKGASRSFCQLDRLGRPAPPPPPPPQPPYNGALATRLQCTICSYKSPVRYDKFDSLSLHLGSVSPPLSVLGLLRAFTAPELLRGVACPRCAAQHDPALPPPLTAHIKSISIGKLPSCLCLHIGRTQWGPAGLSKRGEHVAFQEVLSLAPFTSPMPPKVETDLVSLMSRSMPSSGMAGGGGGAGEEQWRAQYRLQAVVVHVGGPRSGHFVTYRRGNAFEAKRWFYTSDTVVHEVSLEEVLHSSAYMLFYEKMTSANQRLSIRVPHT